MNLSNKILKLIKKRNFNKELLRYSFTGLLKVGLNLGLVYFLKEFLSIQYIFASATGFAFAGFFGFSLNKIWTFRENFMENFWEEYSYFIGFGSVALIIGISLVYVFTGILGFYYVLSQLFAIMITGSFTFTCNEIFTFRSRRKN